MATNAAQSILNKARKDKFILSLTVPEALKNISTKKDRRTHHKSHEKVIPDSLQYSIFGVVVPAVNIPSQDIPQWGQVLKVSSHARAAYDDVTVNFTVDTSFNNYWYIWRWLDLLNDSGFSQYDYWKTGNTKPITETLAAGEGETNEPKYMIDYQTDFTVYGLNEYDTKVVEFVYKRAFPVTLGDISYNYRDTAEVESSFTFSFSQLIVKLL